MHWNGAGSEATVTHTVINYRIKATHKVQLPGFRYYCSWARATVTLRVKATVMLRVRATVTVAI